MFRFCSLVYQAACIGKESGACENAHYAVALGATIRERTMTMNYCKLLLPKTLGLGTIGLATMLLGWTPSCKAQEVSPARFTDTGVEDAYPATRPLPKKPPKVQTATNAIPVTSNKAIARKQKAHQATPKQDAISAAPGL